ncbi:unnamed protein product [Toxocara canis]|uniref:Transcription factor WD40-like family n=1 Tax=Toxocara canis TaxID=6265 RepID=A0A183U2K6_TOXCA|nr:unnamed protein product [Toxocara canis]
MLSGGVRVHRWSMRQCECKGRSSGCKFAQTGGLSSHGRQSMGTIFFHHVKDTDFKPNRYYTCTAENTKLKVYKFGSSRFYLLLSADWIGGDHEASLH